MDINIHAKMHQYKLKYNLALTDPADPIAPVHPVDPVNSTDLVIATGPVIPAEYVDQIEKKIKKKDLTAYWGVHVDNSIFDNELIEYHLLKHQMLTTQSQLHSTILYVGKKVDEREQIFIPLDGKKCIVTIDKLAVDDNAMALNVVSIKYVDEELNADMLIDVPSFNAVQHITMALNKQLKVMAKDSIKTFETAKNIFNFSTPLVIDGFIKRYMY